MTRWGQQTALQALQGLLATEFCSSRAEVLQILTLILSLAAGQAASVHDVPQVESHLQLCKAHPWS